MLIQFKRHARWTALMMALTTFAVNSAPEEQSDTATPETEQTAASEPAETKEQDETSTAESTTKADSATTESKDPTPTPDIEPANRFFNQLNLNDFASEQGNNRIENIGNENAPLFALIQPAENAPILGTGILIPNLNSTVSNAQLERFRAQLQAQGWHVITLSPPQLNLNWLAADKALAETYQATFSERLSALKELPEMAQDNLWVMAQGNSAGYVIQTLLAQNDPAIDALVLYDAAAWNKETQQTLATSVGQLSQPLLDIVFEDASTNAASQHEQRALQAKLAGKANYRQIILPSQYLERHLEDEVYGWTRFLGWQP